jgi:hypothetical protein
MCLSVITTTYDPPIKKERWAWKAFEVRGTGHIQFPYCSYKEPIIPRGQWLEARGGRVEVAGGLSYRAGFHAFISAKAARDWATGNCYDGDFGFLSPKVLHVRVRGIRVLGEQDGEKCLVADELFIPREPKK